MHTFKIVATLEKKLYFTAVPHQWEKNKILYWPKMSHSTREALRSDAASKPEDDWEEYSCTLKFQNIKTFKEALELEKQFTTCYNTDAEEEITLGGATKLKKAARKPDTFEIEAKKNTDRNVADIKAPSSGTSGSSILDLNTLFLEPDGVAENNNMADVAQNQTMWLTSATQAKPMLAELSELKSAIINLKDDVQTLKDEFLLFRKETKEDYKKTCVFFDEILRKMDEMKWSSRTESRNVDVAIEADLLQNYLFPLQSKEDVEKLELDLSTTKNLKQQLLNFFKKIGGVTGEGEASKVGYKIMDTLFTSKVLTYYSWTGIKKKQTEEDKSSFSALKNLIHIIFESLLSCDSRYNLQKHEKFLKDGILKHAKKRYLRKIKQNEERDKKNHVTAEADEETYQIDDIVVEELSNNEDSFIDSETVI